MPCAAHPRSESGWFKSLASQPTTPAQLSIGTALMLIACTILTKFHLRCYFAFHTQHGFPFIRHPQTLLFTWHLFSLGLFYAYWCFLAAKAIMVGELVFFWLARFLMALGGIQLGCVRYRLWLLQVRLHFLVTQVLRQGPKSRAELVTLAKEMVQDGGKKSTDWVRFGDGSKVEFETLVARKP